MSLVLWSGGLDSTLILRNLALEQRDGTQAHPHGIRALSINHPQVSCHAPTVAASRKKIKDVLRRKGLTINYLDITIQQSCEGWRPEGFLGSSSNPQLLLWLTFAVNYLEKDEDLYAGYIHGDDAWHHIGNLRGAFGHLQALAGNTGSLKFPLEWQSKVEVIQHTKAADLYRHCWWCEEMEPKIVRGIGKPCGKCKSCITNDTALWQIERYPIEFPAYRFVEIVK